MEFEMMRVNHLEVEFVTRDSQGEEIAEALMGLINLFLSIADQRGDVFQMPDDPELRRKVDHAVAAANEDDEKVMGTMVHSFFDVPDHLH